MITNPLLEKANLPRFSKIKPHHIKPAIVHIIKENQNALKKLLANKRGKFGAGVNFSTDITPTWENLLEPIEAMNNKLDYIWSIVRHLNSVVNSPKLRRTYKECLPIISKYFTGLRHNSHLYRAIENILQSPNFKKLDYAQQKIINNELRDFRLAGITLSAHDKHEFAKAETRLAKLANKFSNNILDATQGWSILLTKSEISGIPDHALAHARKLAVQKRKPGWLFTLDMPSYTSVLTFADSRKLRQEMYYAYVTRASEIGPNAGKWDNSALMFDILQTRKKLANLVYFNSYAEYSLMTKMLKNPKLVLNFLHELANKTLKTAKQEYSILSEFAQKNYQIYKIQPWDFPYLSEKYAQEKYNISEDKLRPFFPVSKVISGLFTIVNKLYGIKINECSKFDKWHKDVRFFEVRDEKDSLLGNFYFDLYAREGKHSGAWMDSCRTRRLLTTGKLQTPVAYVVCNFSPPVGAIPSLLSPREVKTLFHEFGHCLHHVLTKVNYASVSGTNGVAWDTVEFPSQFTEFWSTEPKTLKLINEHYQTKEKLPEAMLDKLHASHNYLAGIQMLRQLEFALFDFRLHLEFDPDHENQIQEILDRVRKQVNVMPVAPFNRMQHSFQHIFAGGYAAGYYSYKCAEVMAADAFALFAEKGVFDRKLGKKFKENILEQGGAVDPLELFKRFKGDIPKVDSLLKYYGILSPDTSYPTPRAAFPVSDTF